jgi:hypothetical protein
VTRRELIKWFAGAAVAWRLRPRTARGDASIKGARGSIAAAADEAHRRTLPLLVMVIPADEGVKYERGHAFGEFVNAGTDAQIAPLGNVWLAAATMDDVRAVAPAAGAGEPLLVLVHTDGRVARLDAKLPAFVRGGRGDWAAEERAMSAAVDARIKLLSEWVAKNVPAPADRARAAEDAKKLWRQKPPPGTKWARASGCGTVIEGEKPGLMPACGMGHVAEKSARFLMLFASR